MKNEKKKSKTPLPFIRATRGEPAPPALKLLVTIVNRNKAEFYSDQIQSFGCNFQLAATAKGTATQDMLRLLGLSESEKTVLFSIVREDVADETVKMLEEKFRTVRGGKGIAFVSPLSGMIGATSYGFLSGQGGN